ncbi:MAG: DUF433 domain-containing protein [Saprospiraceae bacterium]
MPPRFRYIVCNPKILGGKPIVKGTRISVKLILEWLANGSTITEINTEFPQLSRDAIKEAIMYAAYMSDREAALEITLA